MTMMIESTEPSAPWPPDGCPPLMWPELSDPMARGRWYADVIGAYAALWQGHVSQASINPSSDADLDALEARLGCRLPVPLREYHRQFGALSLAETLCTVEMGDTPIQALREAYPGIVDIAEDLPDGDVLLALSDEMVAFGDYLGNGNMFCFHRRTGDVYYFDHDDGEPLTRFFPSVSDYLDALMIRCLAEIHDDEEGGEALLAHRFGESLVRKWLY
ncbi:hypothetical protein J2W34_002140 [Variovorax boronicumulans]|nr:hypothetical protein [Variovorax boronicumulans]